MDNPWQRVELPYAVLNFATGFCYLLTALLLFLPGWMMTGEIRNDRRRLLLRAGVIAVAFAPALLEDPGGFISVVPASLGSIGSAVIYIASSLPLDFYFYHALLSMLLVWCVGVVVGEVALRVRKSSKDNPRPS